MCGLAGVLSSELTVQDIDAFQDLMLVSTLRGWDGSGLCAVPVKAKADPDIYKTLLSGAELVMTSGYNKLLHQRGSKSLLMGHCRFPTTGKSDDIQFCHPHHVRHIIGAHNGTLTEVDGVPVPNQESDSRRLFESIAEKGIDEAIQGVKGSYALTWLDLQTKTINFLRNDQRPLFIGKFGTKSPRIFWASENKMLDIVVPRRYREAFEVFSVVADTHLSFPIRPNNEVVATSIREVKRKEPPLEHRRTYLWPGEYGGWETQLPAPKNPPTEPLTFIQKDSKTKNGRIVNSTHIDISAEDFIETQEDEYFPVEEVENALSKGCAWCGDLFTLQEHFTGTALWMDTPYGKPPTFLCYPCSGNEDIRLFCGDISLKQPRKR